MSCKKASIKRVGFVLGTLGLLVPAPAPAQEPANPPPQTQPTTAPAPSEELGFAEDEDVGLLELEMPIVITATRREQSIATVPYAISVITAEDIRRSAARSVPDALRLVPGMDVAELTYGDAAVSPRGMHAMTARTTLVLVDGRQIFDSLFGGTLWGSWPFQLEDIERIEVIRGPGGVTWGANAVQGVINIITKNPADRRRLARHAQGASGLRVCRRQAAAANLRRIRSQRRFLRGRLVPARTG
jgi:iron complex outermembrane receptor protein